MLVDHTMIATGRKIQRNSRQMSGSMYGEDGGRFLPPPPNVITPILLPLSLFLISCTPSSLLISFSLSNLIAFVPAEKEAHFIFSTSGGGSRGLA